MNIICNNCIGGRLYEVLNKQFNNPFMWMRILPNEYVYLIKNFKTINFNNVSFSLEEFKYKGQFNVICNLDDKLNVHYTHYFLNENYESLIKMNSNVYYKDIINYAKEKYFNRLAKMKEEPTFVFSTNGINLTNEELVSVLYNINEIDTSFKIYIVINKDFMINELLNNHKHNIEFICLSNSELNSDTKNIANLIKSNIHT